VADVATPGSAATTAEQEPAASTPDTTLRRAEPVTVPARCTGAEIRYCPQAESLRLEGQIVVEVRIDENGRVLDPSVVRSDDAVLSSCALRSVVRMRCEPATRNGTAVESRHRILFDFRLPR